MRTLLFLALVVLLIPLAEAGTLTRCARTVRNHGLGPLLPAVGKSDGWVLTPKAEGIENHPQFNPTMGAAIDAAEAKLREILPKRIIYGSDLWAELLEIGQARRAAWSFTQPPSRRHYNDPARIREGAAEGEGYGIATPKTVRSFAEIYPHPPSQAQYLRGAFDKATIKDHISPHGPFHMHTPKASKLLAHYRSTHKQTVSVSLNGEKRTFSLCNLVSGCGFFSLVNVHHPGFVESRAISETALDILAQALNDDRMLEEEFLEEAGKAHFLMMHGTPFLNGSPACVHALIEACVRAKYGKTLNRLKPGLDIFWKAIFDGIEHGQAGMDRFVAEYPSFFLRG